MLTVKKWDVAELSFEGSTEGNPFVDVTLEGEFRYKNRTVTAPGFYDGEGVYKLRFMPDETGEWSVILKSNCEKLDGKTASFVCESPDENAHGPVRVVNKYNFAYEDGTPYYQVGTTCYVWNLQPKALREKTVETLKTAPFNKMRMCVFPKNYQFNANPPEHYAFEGNEEDGFDLTRFNIKSWEILDECVLALRDLGIEADIILFHPYDKGRWGFDRMDREADDLYLRYAVARLAAYRNVWWSFANEFDLMNEKTEADWDHYGPFVQQLDPHNHLRGIHNCRGFYDHTKQWVTHCSVQSSDINRILAWREMYGKPVVLDECRYEGNISNQWGHISPQEMTDRFWECLARGAYCGHGETYMNDRDELWWSKGGELIGGSVPRIAFFKKILEEMPANFAPIYSGYRTKPIVGVEGEQILYYSGTGQPAVCYFMLPEGQEYNVDIINAWDMTIDTLEKTVSGSCEVKLPGKQYTAVRLRRA
ncbi:MAG: DUF5060 domain-containing protein [Christensenellales bacterium]|jgi:hypothetical protein